MKHERGLFRHAQPCRSQDLCCLPERRERRAYCKARGTLKRDRTMSTEFEHRQVKFLNSRLEADHGGLKRLNQSDPRLQADAISLRDH